MRQLDSELERFVTGGTGLQGTTLMGDTIDPTAVAALEGRLGKLHKKLEVYFWICVGMILLLFVLEVALV
jgi:hypothetical protein